MEKELKIGLASPTISIIEILNQIGVSFSVISSLSSISSTNFSLIIINRRISNKETIGIKQYVRNGGIIIDFGYCLDKIVKGTIERKRIDYIIPENIPFLPPMNSIDIYNKIGTFSKAQYLKKTLFIDDYGKGFVSFFGINIDKLFLNTKSRRKEFYSNSKRFPNEEVSLVSKGEISLLFFYLLKHLHSIRNLPFIHKWFFPNKAQNVFLFRIDSDFGNQKQIRRWYELSQKNKIKYTWFLHTKAHKRWLSIFSEFEDHEMAVHGYDHFFSKSSNESNIKKAKEIMKQKGLYGKGYASPYGLWNKKLNITCEKFDFIYSSEFSYIYDSLPLRPIFKDRISSVIQIPIHPICVGSLLSAKMDDEDIVNYYFEEFDKKIIQFTPLIFYDHVLHNSPSILQHLFNKISLYSFPCLTFLEYALWWNERLSTNFSSIVNNDQIEITSFSNQSKDFSLCIWVNDKDYILTNNKKTIKLSTEKKYHVNKNNLVINPEKLQLTRKFNPRLLKLSILNKLVWRNYQ